MKLDESDDFVAIKNSLIDRLVVAMLLLLILALVGSFYRWTVVGFQPVMAVHVLISFVFFGVYLKRRKFSARLKGSIMVATLFVAGAAGLINFGLVGAGTLILLSSGILACLVISSRAAIGVIVAGGVLQVVYVSSVHMGKLSSSMNLGEYALSLPAWINNLFAYLVLSGVCLFVIDKFFTYLKTVSLVMQHAVEEKHKELEHSEVLLQTVINSLPFGVFWKKRDLTFWGANERFIEDIGRTNINQILGKRDRDLRFGENTERFEQEDNEVLDSGVPKMGIVIESETKFGKKYYSLTNKVPLRDKQGEMIGILGTYSDITEQKSMENALREAIEEARAASLAKSEFLATMSHEIRTPINGVMGLLELSLETNLDEKQREYLNKANLSAKMLLQIINQILDISKIEAGKMDLERVPFCISDVVQQLEQQLKHLALAKNLEFAINSKGAVDEKVDGDPTKLLQILVNLTSNAIKFTEAGSVIVEVGALKQETQLQLRIKIKDTGIGIPEEHQKHLFQSFTQADSSTTRKFGGTGLGLSIVKQLLEMQGGTVELTSEPEEGTEFVCFIAYEYAKEEVMDNRQTKTISLVGKRILLAEDNEINQLIATEMLSHSGASVDVAGDGIIAIEKIKEKQFDVVLMDIQMPNMDGTEALKQIREMPEFSSLPVIALTANVLAHEVKYYQEIGFTAHLGKPFQKEQLVSKINEVLH